MESGMMMREWRVFRNAHCSDRAGMLVSIVWVTSSAQLVPDDDQ